MSHRPAPGLATLARLWVSRATGLVTGAEPGAQVRLSRGGLVDAADLFVLSRLIHGGPVHFTLSSVAGTPDRTSVARLLVNTAVRSSPGPTPTARTVELQPLVALTVLEELGLHIVARDAGGRLSVLADDVFLAAEALRLVRAAGRPRVPTNPGFDAAPPPEPTTTSTDPEFDFNVLPLGAADLSVELVDPTTANAEVDDGLRCARAHLAAGDHAAADRTLVRLRDRRVDEPNVLYLLICTKLQADPVPEPRVLSELRRWFRLADLLGGGDDREAAAEALARIEHGRTGSNAREPSPGDRVR